MMPTNDNVILSVTCSHFFPRLIAPARTSAPRRKEVAVTNLHVSVRLQGFPGFIMKYVCSVFKEISCIGIYIYGGLSLLRGFFPLPGVLLYQIILIGS